MHHDLLTALKTQWATTSSILKARWDALRGEPEAGYSTETVLVTALLVVAALAIIALIVAKVTAKASGISL
ncbi:hypothetical protein [Amycolatopsis sp. H20-H5]|uniref:hypothetical protein n=1 Tax=Amycolatopsis sp. H20-H5 TaxID=3046309 RepID=UPI002DB6FB77|nr:hypothetical protein [Amycolatopsis sp. H20-H5]MEC3978888.1 hypothetical protein [Amycolatopsis sp. H20-H5]